MDVPRYEINRQVRVTLNKHDIDTTMVNYSFIGGTVYLSGDLLKNGEGVLVPPTIENMLKDISVLSGVRDIQTDFRNWSINRSGGDWQITKGRKKPVDIGDMTARWAGQADAAKEVHIETSEELSDVLKEVRKKPKPE